MSDVQERRVYAQVGGPDGLHFDFEEVCTAEQFDFAGSGAEAMALASNYRCNMLRLKEADLPAEYKRDVRCVSQQAMRDKFIELGVPAHLAFAFEVLVKGFAYDDQFADIPN
jgi:hypothetical protein